QHGIFRDAGYSAHDVTWAIVTFADGAVVNFGISYALPANYPTQGQSDRVELLGTDGTMIIDDDHMEHLIFSEKGIPHPYVPGHSINLAFLGSNTAGDWAGRGRARHAGAGHAQSKNHLRHRARGRDRAGGADGLAGDALAAPKRP